MYDPIDIIDLDSSPPDSPLFDVPLTQNKVSEMCKTSNIESIRLKNNVMGNCPNPVKYHSLSDSDGEYFSGGTYIPTFENEMSEGTNCEDVLNCKETYQTAPLSQSSNNSKRNDRVLDKKLQKEIKAKEKAEKAKEKAERIAMLEKIKQSKPGQCMKYITLILDDNLMNCNIGKKALELFSDVEFNYKVEAQRDSCSVTWTREEPGPVASVTKEKHILFVWSYDKLITAVKFCNLIETFKELKNQYVDFRIYLAIYGLGDYYKRLSKKSNDGHSNVEEGAARKRRKTVDVPKEQIDMAIAELEILLKITTRLIKNHHELSILFQQITKAIAETPYRKEIEKRDQEKGWYTRGDSRDCVKIDKDLNGLHRLWLQQLSQFNKSSLDAAKSIAEVYPSPSSLYQAYENLSTQKEKDLLLQDIKIKKGAISTRRIGPELSRKVSLLFSQEDGDIYLSQE